MQNENNGWNGTTVMVGATVRVWAKGFGRGVTAVVRELQQNGSAVIEITKTSKQCAYSVGNQISLGAWWLEGAL